MSKLLSAFFAALLLLSAPAFAQVPPQWTYSNVNGNAQVSYQGNVLVLGSINPQNGITTSSLNLTGPLTSTSSGSFSTVGAVSYTGTSLSLGGAGTFGASVGAQSFMGAGSATFAAGAAAGTGPSIACTSSRICDSISGTVTLTTGTATTTGTLATITLPITRTNAPNCVVKIKTVAGTAYNDTESTTAITLTAVTALTASTAYTITYICGGA
jgi:hypothetical protein